MRVAFLGPEGTFSEEALTGAAPPGLEAVPAATVHDAIMAVQRGEVERALVPIENALEGSVDETIDTLALPARDVVIVGEVVHPVRQCLAAARDRELGEIEVVVSHPQATAQCARFLREHLSGARVLAANSTAEAVRQVVAEPGRPWAALGPRMAAHRYGAHLLREGVEDLEGNATRFVWLARRGAAPTAAGQGRRRTSLVFQGAGDERPGWLVRCLAEFASREVNLTRIESRPRKDRLGHHLFFVDVDGGESDAPVSEAVRALRAHCEEVRSLGSYPAA